MSLHNWYIDDEIRRQNNAEIANEIKRNREIERALAGMAAHPSPLSWLASWVNRINPGTTPGNKVSQVRELNPCCPFLERSPELEA